MTEKIKEQIKAVRDSGETNMLDSNMVQYMANREGFHELAVYIEENRQSYFHFIMTGKEN